MRETEQLLSPTVHRFRQREPAGDAVSVPLIPSGKRTSSPTEFRSILDSTPKRALRFSWANEERKARIQQPHREPRVNAELRAKILVPASFHRKTTHADGPRSR